MRARLSLFSQIWMVRVSDSSWFVVWYEDEPLTIIVSKLLCPCVFGREEGEAVYFPIYLVIKTSGNPLWTAKRGILLHGVLADHILHYSEEGLDSVSWPQGRLSSCLQEHQRYLSFHVNSCHQSQFLA